MEENIQEAIETPVEENPIETVETQEEPEVSKSDRTQEQFEKLKKSNQELKAERDQYKSVLDTLVPVQEVQAPKEDFKNLTQDQIDSVFKDMTDADGYIDGEKLLSTLKTLDERTRAAEERAKRVEEHAERMRIAEEKEIKTQQVKAVHEKYPELDPDNVEEFDPDFWHLVRNELFVQATKGEEDFMKAADAMVKFKPSKIEDETVKAKAEEAQTQKQQSSMNRPRHTTATDYFKNEEEEVLRQKIRAGTQGAVAEMLRRRGQ